MEQYGFVVPGNPLDRVQFPLDLLQDTHGWMSHKAVKAAAKHVLQQPRQQPHQQDAQLAAGGHYAAEVVAARMDAVVASVLQYRGWRNVQQYKQTTQRSTAACAAAMLQWVQAQLHLQPEPAADSAAAHQLEAMPGEGRLLSALQYRLERELVLHSVAALLEVLVGGETPELPG